MPVKEVRSAISQRQISQVDDIPIFYAEWRIVYSVPHAASGPVLARANPMLALPSQ